MKSVDPSIAYRLLYPSVPAVVAAGTARKVSAMPVASVVSLSNKPALVGFSSSPSHDTYQTIAETGRFTVSWLDEKYRKAVERMGSTSGREVADKLEASGLHRAMAGSPPVPFVAEAVALMVCTVSEVKTYGDHRFIVAALDEVKASDDFSDYWSFREYRPILYSGSSGPRLTLP